MPENFKVRVVCAYSLVEKRVRSICCLRLWKEKFLAWWSQKGLLERAYWKEFTGKALLERASDWSLAIEELSKGISGCQIES